MGGFRFGSIRDARPIYEPSPVRDVFVSNLAWIDILDGNVRFVMCSEHAPEEGAEMIRVLEAKLVMPRAAVLPAINRTLFALGHAAISSINDQMMLRRC